MNAVVPLLLTLFGLSAHAADEPARDTLETIAQDAVDLQNDLAAILESVKTKEQLEKARDKIAKIHLAAERLKARIEKLLSDPDPSRLLASLAGASDKQHAAAAAAEKRYRAALGKLPADAREFLESDLVEPTGFEGLLKEYVKLINQIADVVEKVQTKADLDKHRADLERLGKKMAALEVRGNKLGKPDGPQAQKLMETHMPKLMQASERAEKAMRQLPRETREEVEQLTRPGKNRDKKLDKDGEKKSE